MKSQSILMVVVLNCFLVIVSNQELAGQVIKNVELEKGAQKSNGPIESLRHFLRDMKNITSGFLSNRIDGLRISSQKVIEKANQWFQNIFKSNNKLLF